MELAQQTAVNQFEALTFEQMAKIIIKCPGKVFPSDLHDITPLYSHQTENAEFPENYTGA